MYYLLDFDYPQSRDNVYYDIQEGVDFDGVGSWLIGKAFDKAPPDPMVVEITLTGEWAEPLLPPITFGHLCLMNEPVVAALRSIPVTNIDVYPAILRDSVHGREYRYFGVNVLGVLQAVDATESEGENLDGEHKYDTIYTTLVLDENQCMRQDMFRLFESLDIIVSERVKKALEHIPFVKFHPATKTK